VRRNENAGVPHAARVNDPQQPGERSKENRTVGHTSAALRPVSREPICSRAALGHPY